MQVGRKHIKSIEEYRHNIKLLKYYLKKEQRINDTLKYKSIKNNQKLKNKDKNNDKPKERIYTMLDTVSKLNQRMKQMGITLGDLFRMADVQYEGQINKGQFLKVVNQLKADIEENIVQELFYAIDTNLNGILDEDQYLEFLCAYGGADLKDALRFQKKTLQKLAAQLKKKSIKSESFLADSMDPINVYDFKKKLSSFSLNENQIMILLKAFDPASTGQISHEFYIEQIKTVKQKNQQMIANEQMEKDIKYMCIQWRQKKINPIKIFEEADTDKKDGISPFELQQAFVKLMPNETKFNVKKWVKIINLNNDRQITRQQFVNSIRSFYALNQLEKFSTDYEKQHPNAKRSVNNEEISIQTIMKQLEEKIQDSKMTKTMAFKSMDINGDGQLNKEQLTEGLKKLGLNIVFIGRVLTVFDRNCSGSIELDEWLKILGEDVQMSQVDVPDDDDFEEPVKTKPQVKTKPEPKAKLENIKKDKLKESQKSKAKNNDKKNDKPLMEMKKTDTQKKDNTKTGAEQSKVSKTQISTKQNKSDPKTSKTLIKDTKITNETKGLKQSKQNTIKESTLIQKTKKEQKPKAQVQEKDEYDYDYDDHQEPQIEVSEIEKQIGIKYKKRPQEVLEKFKKFNLKNKPIISLKSLKTALESMEVSYTPEQAEKIFEDNIESGGNMNYEIWLEKIAQEYAGDVKKQISKVSEQNSNLRINRTNSNMIDSKKKSETIIKQPTINKKLQTQKKPQPSNESKIQVSNQQQQTKLHEFIEISPELQAKRKEFMKKAKKLKQNKQKFTDTDFPPSLKSISSNPETSKINNASQKVKFLKWKHYSQIYKNPLLVQGKIEPNDIIQGGLGNCYFLSALACLAEYPNLIERLFEYSDIESGYFLIWLCIDGSWNLFQIDGSIVVNAAGMQPYFSHNNTQQLWVMLLEKAYAKAYGSYENIIGGDPATAIKDLSGSPSQTLVHEQIKEQQMWQKLCQANKNQFIMAAGTDQKSGQNKKVEDRPESVTEEGLVLGHAYSILDLHEQGRERIIQLRNPWGKIEWKGNWSDQSSKWTQKMRKKLNYYGNADDGIFWMPFEEFFKRYKTTSVNFLRATNHYHSSIHPKASSLVVKASGPDIKELYITVNQEDQRKILNASGKQYTRVAMIPVVCQKEQQTVRVVKKMNQKIWRSARQAFIKFQDITEYEEVITIIKLDSPTTVGVSLYANCKLDYSVQPLSNDDELQYFEAIAFEASDEDKNQTQGLEYWVSSAGNKAFLCFKNKFCQNSKVNIDISQVENLKIISPQKIGKNTLKISKGQIKSIRAQIVDTKKEFSFKDFSLQLSE